MEARLNVIYAAALAANRRRVRARSCELSNLNIRSLLRSPGTRTTGLQGAARSAADRRASRCHPEAVSDLFEHPLGMLAEDAAEPLQVALAGRETPVFQVAEGQMAHAQLAGHFGLAEPPRQPR